MKHPATCKLKIAKSTEAPGCAAIEDNGGYTVQPVPAPMSTKALASNKIKEGINNSKTNIIQTVEKPYLGAPSCIGTK